MAACKIYYTDWPCVHTSVERQKQTLQHSTKRIVACQHAAAQFDFTGHTRRVRFLSNTVVREIALNKKQRIQKVEATCVCDIVIILLPFV